jgi:hypothetical protein
MDGSQFNIQLDVSKEVLLKVNIEDVHLIEKMINNYLKAIDLEIEKTNTMGGYYVVRMEYEHTKELKHWINSSLNAYDCGHLVI